MGFRAKESASIRDLVCSIRSLMCMLPHGIWVPIAQMMVSLVKQV
jgi:hypothetical protein